MKVLSTRQRIVETASQLFYTNGYNATGINEIIDRAGIAKATLYAHFRSKEDLCVAHLRYKDEIFSSEIAVYCAERPVGKPRLLALFDYLTEFYDSVAFNGCWCINTVSEIPRDNDRIRTEIQRQKDGLIRFITGLVQTNLADVNQAEVTVLARQIYLIYEGAVAESHLQRAQWPIEAAKKICALLI